ncbi:probable imidazolonepropionase [Schistocerca americana]|uniref:probable imidazolonepropionase n=1 Tax=Schistocerca americana TaxID=7009 RepID=UPI001F4F390A|nr:probable imidazolonepropionase [Schistocerca americana]
MRLLIHSADQVVTPVSVERGRKPEVRVLHNAAIAIDEHGRIAAVGDSEAVCRRYEGQQFDARIDASGRCVMPGFVDAHTHPVWAGDRSHEFAMKLAGATYLEIHEKGGGIYFTVEQTSKASDDELYASLKERLTKMLQAGTTLAEVKSGYGLEAAAELRLLRLLERARRDLPLELSVTYCGAHAVPRGKTAEEAVRDIVEQQIPSIKKLVDAGELAVENIDVFCEKGVFSTDQARAILEKGKEAGMRPNFHGDELNPMGCAQLAVDIGAWAVSHLEEVSTEGVAALGSAHQPPGAVLLPTTALLLQLQPPPARQLLDAGALVALGSDFNPNAHCYAMPIVMLLACILMRMSVEEALVAATLNAAATLGRADRVGSIEEGKAADLVIIDASRWEHIIYQFGCHDNLIAYVIKNGKLVHCKKDAING